MSMENEGLYRLNIIRISKTPYSLPTFFFLLLFLNLTSFSEGLP